MTAGTINYLDKVPRGYTPRLSRSRRGRHSGSNTPADSRPRTTETGMLGGRPLREPFLAGVASAASPSRRGEAPRSRSANYAGRADRDQRRRQHGHFSRLPGGAEDENDMVGRWNYASSEDHVSGATASGISHPADATTGTGVTAESGATMYSVGSASQPTLASVGSTGDVGDEQVL